eukprot:GFUD01025998.1.p1 GENE.GFUD01025998.1~~GFUD01025998.1.p1  ORF type:complete len:660 (-),score=136.74 GFUD01025998.1:77-2056(-)
MGNCCGKKIKQFDQEQKYRKIRTGCRRSNTLFEDEKFPASNSLLSGNEERTFSYFGKRWNCSEIKWLRPGEICQNLGGLEPRMVVGERDRFDVNQGEIGDCWFLAPLASLAENEHYFDKVVPRGQDFDKNYQGVFRFRFYRFGEWHEVVIDDRLPTRNGKLIYLRAKEPNEFWSPLLEKAYAKFYGSYAAIEGGISMDAAVDFTGGIPQMINIEKDLDEVGSEQLFHLLKISDRNDAIITCALGNKHRYEAESKGLQASHAYSITKVKDIKDPNSNASIPLLRLRNPHGNEKEWNGDWSDGSEQWNAISKRVKKKLGLEFESDGEFYMSYNRDFLRYFGNVEIVNLNPIRMELNEEKMTRKFNLFEIYGQWQRGVSAGGTNSFEKNPQHNFTISNKRDKTKECSVVITLTQKLARRKGEYSIGFRLYDRKEEQNDRILPPDFINNAFNVTATSGAYINSREVSKTFSLPEGSYCLVPSTFASGQEAEYLVRVYVDNRWSCQTEGKRFTIKDHKCCFICCCFWGSSSKCCKGSCIPSCSPSCCQPSCNCLKSSQSSSSEPSCACRKCCKPKCCQDDDDDYYKPSEDRTDGGKVRRIKIELVESTGIKERKRDKILGKIGEKYPKAMDKLVNFQDFYHWNDSTTSEIKLLRKIANFWDNET